MRAVYADEDGEPLVGGILGAPATSPVRIEFSDTLVIEPVASGTFDVDVTIAGLGGADSVFVR